MPVKALSFRANTRLPVDVVLNQKFTVPAGTVLAAAVRDSAGNIVHAAGTCWPRNNVLPACGLTRAA